MSAELHPNASAAALLVQPACGPWFDVYSGGFAAASVLLDQDLDSQGRYRVRHLRLVEARPAA